VTVVPTLPLLDGNTVPAVGFGSPDVDPARGEALFLEALDAGYRLIDTAQAYGNEEVVGAALARTSVPREKIQVATKISGANQGRKPTLSSFEESRRKLGVDYVDFLLIHWPNPEYDLYVETWGAMIELRDRGVVRSIGVCNFTDAFLQRLEDETGVLPVVNQIERHPLFPNQAQVDSDARRGIVTESWSALGRGHAFVDDPVIAGIAAAHGVTAGQVVLRWHVQGGSVPLSYSTRAERIRQNIDVFSFALTDDEMTAVSGLETGRIWGQDPADSNYL